MSETLLRASHFLPIATTVIAASFAWAILSRFRQKPEAKHLLWWGIGVITYGAGTLVESLITLFGWSEFLFKSWYITGALLGGAPLAIGTIFLLFGGRAGTIAVALLVTTVAVASVLVILSPVDMSLVNPHIPNGKVLEWQGIRRISPFLNGLAALFLIGGAFYSAGQYFKRIELKQRFYGNLSIAVGAILPGVGGYLSRKGYTEALYVGELLGLILIWLGYRWCQKNKAHLVSERSPVVSRGRSVSG